MEQKQEQKKEMERLIKKLSMTCRSDLDLEKDKQKEKELQEKIKGKVSRSHKIYKRLSPIAQDIRCLLMTVRCSDRWIFLPFDRAILTVGFCAKLNVFFSLLPLCLAHR